MTSASDRADPGLYARSFADVYDRWYAALHDIDGIVAAITARTRPDAAVLELGSGSGRLAGPLARHRRVVALDASMHMLTQDRTTPQRVAADMASVPCASASFDLVIVAFNTLFNLGSHERQQRCLAEAARVLGPNGGLVVEAFIAPSVDPADPFGISVSRHHTDPDGHLAIVTWNDRTRREQITGAHVELGPSGVRSRPWYLTYQSPAALDRSAAAAGFSPVERYADWGGAPFDPASAHHVSWYRRTG